MANIKFNGTLANSSYIFADGANWLGGIAPGAADRAIVDTALTFTFSGDGAVAQLQVTQASVAMTGTITANGSLGHELDVSNGGTFYILPGARFDGVNAGVNDDIIGEATGLQPAAFVVLEGELDADLTVLQPSGHLAVGFGSVLTGGITGNGGELYVYPVIGGAGKTVVVNNNIDLIGGTTRLDGDPSFPLEVSGVITNTATLQLAFSVTLTGALIGDGVLEVAGGLVTLNDTDSHSGGTNLLSGTLALDAPALAGGGPGSGKLAISGGTLLAAADGTITNQLAMFSSIEIAATHGQTVIFQPTSGWSLDRTGAQVTFGDSVNDGVVVWTNPSGSSVTGSGSYVVDIADGTLRLGDSNYTSLLGSGGVTAIEVNGSLDVAGHVASVSNLVDVGTIIDSGSGGSVAVGGVSSISGVVGGALGLDVFGTLTLTGSATHLGGTTVEAGGELVLGSGAKLTGDILNNGSVQLTAGTSLTLAGVISGSGAIAQGGSGRLVLAAPNGYAGGTSIGAGATLELAMPTSAGSGSIDFAGPGSASTLRIDAAEPGNAIGGFAFGDTIDLAWLPFAQTTGLLSYDGSTLTIVANPTSAALHFKGLNVGVTAFNVNADAQGGTAVTLACFRRGTRIATARGDMPVEELRVGETVMAGGGDGPMAACPARWIGHRLVDCRRHPAPRQVWPVRIVAGAFGPGRPRRDLFLSPDHAVFVDDVLIPVRHLINDRTITQVEVNDVEYFHVELAAHAVVRAEGLAVESYLDTGDRANFDTCGGPVTLYPDFATRTWESHGCAMLIVAGPQLQRVRAQLDAVAAGIESRLPQRPRSGDRTRGMRPVLRARG